MADEKKNIIMQLQILFGVTKAELLFVSVIFVGLFAGMIIRGFDNSDETNKYNSNLSELVFRTLDSLAEAERTTYIGTDLKNNPIPELAKGDTVVAKDSYYGNKKKEMPSGKIDINTASKTELMKLPGVGEKTALSILEFRTNSPFRKPDDITKIKGIGPKKFEKMKEFIEIK
ncbi:MAG: helix-hairpin-helix domain-containing protein [Bacteroidota bacterium]